MDLAYLIDLALHLNKHLAELVAEHGPLVYAILFGIVFCETGLVIMPFLPGDSLLFAAGAIAASGGFNLAALCVVLIVAAILGDTVNYWVGSIGGTALASRFPRLVRPEYIARTHSFYERYGSKTIIFARFVPIVRTFAPFVAGIGKMSYGRFMTFNITGGLLWVLLLVPAGYLFGDIDWVKKNFSVVTLAIIFISILPMVIEILREWRRGKVQSPSA